MRKVFSLFAVFALVLALFSGFSGMAEANDEYVKVYLDKLSFTECVIEDGGKGSPFYDKDYLGNPLSINGRVFEKGIMTHPRADEPFILTYNIEGAGFERFQAWVGPDDVGYGAVQFFVLLDGEEVFASRVSKKADGLDAEFIDVDVRGAKTITLKHTDGGDTYGGDSGCFGDACFLKKISDGGVVITSPAPSALYKDFYAGLSSTLTVAGASSAEKVRVFVNGKDLGNDVPVTDGLFAAEISGLIERNCVITVKGYIGGAEKGADTVNYVRGGDVVLLSDVAFAADSEAVRNKNADGSVLSAGGFIAENGFSILPANTDASSSYKDIIFNIEGCDYGYISAVVGISDTANVTTRGSAEVKILADGAEVYSSGEMKAKNKYLVGAEIPAGAKTVTLRTGNYDGSNRNAVVNWCDPMLVKDENTLTREGERLYEGLKSSGSFDGKDLYQQIKTTESFVGLTLGVKGSGKVTIDVYNWATSCKNTLTKTPVLSAEAEIKDGKASFPFYKVLPAGEYLIAVTGGNIKYYADGVGTIYSETKTQKGVLEMSVNFTASGADLLSETVGQSGFGYSSTRATAAEKERAENILKSYTSDMSKFPFSVSIGGTVYNGFGEGFTFVSKSDPVKHESKAKETVTYVYDHVSGLRFTLYLDVYKDNAAFSWYMAVKNIKDSDSPKITKFYSANLVFEGENPYIYTLGGVGSAYTPVEFPLKMQKSYAETTGRSTENNWPYWNMMYGDGGAFIAVGWTGNWAADFKPDGVKTSFRAYQKALNGYLKPGEEIESPIVATVYYDGRDYDRSVNVWRHFLIDCVSVRDENGELLKPQISCYTGHYTAEMGSATEDQQLNVIETYIANGVTVDYWWMDACWHTDFQFWIADPARFPTGLKAISDRMAEVGGKTLLWFAPETTTYNKSNAPTNEIDGDTLNPDWIIEGYATSSNLNLMDMTNPDAVEFLKNRIIKAMEKGGIDIYREDMNYLPGLDWTNIDRANPQRSGIFENLYVQGHYDLWDGLREHFTGLFIDTCASGGTRLDIKTLSYANPQHRIDYYGYFNDDCARLQSQTLSLMQWIPYNGVLNSSQSNASFTKYRMRSSMTPWSGFACDARKKPDWDIARTWVSEKRRTDEYVYEDYYALTPWSYEETDWCAYEYYSEEKASGYALVFRRARCDESSVIKFKGLDPDKNYVLTFEDAGTSMVKSGKELLYNGITVTIPAAESSELIWFEEGSKATVTPITVTVNQSHNLMEKKKNRVVDLFDVEDGFVRFSLHLSATILDTAVAKGEATTIDLDKSFYDYFTVAGKKLSEFEGAKLKYDLLNNFIDFYIPKNNGVSVSDTFDVVVSGKLKSELGVPVYGEYTFSYDGAARTMSASVIKNIIKDDFSSPLGWVIAGVAAAASASVAAFVLAKKKKAK